MEIKHIMLPPSPREFRDIFVVFELMETDLHQVTFTFSPPNCHLLTMPSFRPPRSLSPDCVVVESWGACAVQVIKANDDLTPEHHQFFLYQMLRGLKYIHTGTQPGTVSDHRSYGCCYTCVHERLW